MTTWLILREPGKVPVLKGPFPSKSIATTLRDFMAARPTAFITVLTIHREQPLVQDGPECLESLDGRSSPTAAKHRTTTREAHGNHTVRA